ncbi:hypothetical protein MUA04_08900 [Enterobacteriaceae bacterium H11S18]|nr:hypothetical protein [Dryocola clanedunensis]MCT4710306.1 hypothetical protein [Dryocola clanedunensis]
MLHEKDDADFIAMMSGELEEAIDKQINLAAERSNEQVSWQEFRGDFQ